jgi:hypothetical protein
MTYGTGSLVGEKGTESKRRVLAGENWTKPTIILNILLENFSRALHRMPSFEES